jgi:long-chain fatty acid transport protein
MKRILTTAAAMSALAGGASAGALDRSGQSIAAIFEAGNYAELSFGAVAPTVSGQAVAPFGTAPSGDMSGNFNQLGMAIKMDFNDSLALGLIYDQPFGANVDYPAGTGYYAAGTTAELKTTALTLVAKYRLPSNLSFIGGIRYQTYASKASIPFVAEYSVVGEKDGAVGYLAGVSYERPDIALRVALTYNSAIKHDLATRDASLLTGGLFVDSTTRIETPQSVNLEFQSGIAKDTLLFGSVRWVDWSPFVIDPAGYPPEEPLVSYSGDYTTYNLGIGRRFNENWAAAVSLGYEKPLGGFSSNLGPSDGQRSIGLAATYSQGPVKITAGARYVELGDAVPTLGGGIASANFSGNRAVAVGLKVGYTF